MAVRAPSTEPRLDKREATDNTDNTVRPVMRLAAGHGGTRSTNRVRPDDPGSHRQHRQHGLNACHAAFLPPSLGTAPVVSRSTARHGQAQKQKAGREGSHRQHRRHGKGLSRFWPLAMAARDRPTALTPANWEPPTTRRNTVKICHAADGWPRPHAIVCGLVRARKGR